MKFLFLPAAIMLLCGAVARPPGVPATTDQWGCRGLAGSRQIPHEGLTCNTGTPIL